MPVSSFSSKKLSSLLFFLLLSLCLAWPAGPVYAGVGPLDTSFGTSGIANLALGGYETNIRGIAVQPDGKILATGTYYDPTASLPDGAYMTFVARFCQNGQLDDGTHCGTAFGTNGVATRLVGEPLQQMDVNRILLMPDGKIVVTGYATTISTGLDFFAIRFSASGAPDNAFGGSGVAWVNIAVVGNDYAYEAILQPDGKILLAGTEITEVSPGTYQYAGVVVRMNSDGSLDTGFNPSGLGGYNAKPGVVTIKPRKDNMALALGTYPDGKILVTGYTDAGTNTRDTLLVRLCPNGSLDDGVNCGAGGFGTGGTQIYDFSASNNDQVYSLKIYPDGKFLGAGARLSGARSDVLVGRFNSDGSLDTTFNPTGGTPGTVVTAVSATYSNNASSVVLQSDGNILVGGVTYTSASTNDFVLLRYTSTGSLDTTFNPTGSTPGIAVVNVNTPGIPVNADNYTAQIRVLTNGQLLLAGSSGAYNVGAADEGTGSLLLFNTGSTQVKSSQQVGTALPVTIGDSNVIAQFTAQSACTGGVVSVTKTLSRPGTSGYTTLPAWWAISTDCAGSFDLDLSICYTDAELAAPSTAVEANLQMYHFASGWNLMGGTLDASKNCVTLQHVTALSPWALADLPGPTAVRLVSAQASTAVPSNWPVLAGLGALLAAAAGLGWRRFFQRQG